MESGGPYEAYSYSTNDLWLEITGFTNCTASLVIHRPWDDTNAYHDLFYTTNLAAPINWHFVQRYVSTNVSVPDLGDAQGFFRLGQTNGALTVTTNVTAQAYGAIAGAALGQCLQRELTPGRWWRGARSPVATAAACPSKPA